MYEFGSDIQREEKSVEKTIKEAAKRNDMGSAKVSSNSFLLLFLALDFRNNSIEHCDCIFSNGSLSFGDNGTE